MPKLSMLAGQTVEATSTSYTNVVDRLESLTFLRFIAALVVVIFHYGSGTSIYENLPTILNCGPIMVTFFFVLSGFVLAISSTKKNIPLSQFYVNRIARILPIYLIALLAYVIITGNSFSGGLVLSATLVQSWFPRYATSLNYPGWSVSVEVFFYAICPLLILIANAKKKTSLNTWFASAVFFWIASQVILSHYSHSNSGPGTTAHSLINYFPPSHLCSFVLGFTAGLFFKAGLLRKVIGEKTALSLSILLFAAISKLIDYGPIIDNTTGIHIAYASSFTAILFAPAIYFCAIANNLLKKVALMPGLVMLGESSYSLYILQEPAHLVFQMIPTQLKFESGTINFSVFVMFLIALSIASHILIEKPFSKAIKRYYAKRVKPSALHKKAVA